jgi:hypothetical protein
MGAQSGDVFKRDVFINFPYLWRKNDTHDYTGNRTRRNYRKLNTRVFRSTTWNQSVNSVKAEGIA